jgi:hypothetical protein
LCPLSHAPISVYIAPLQWERPWLHLRC